MTEKKSFWLRWEGGFLWGVGVCLVVSLMVICLIRSWQVGYHTGTITDIFTGENNTYGFKAVIVRTEDGKLNAWVVRGDNFADNLKVGACFEFYVDSKEIVAIYPPYVDIYAMGC